MRKLAVLCAALLGSVILVSCGSDGGSSGGAPARPDMGTAAPAIAPGLREQAPSPSDSTATDSAERKEVITGSVDITSDDPIAAAGRVAEQVRALDGRIDSRTEQPGTDDNDPSATLTVRVPADRTDSFVDGLGGIGTVTRVSTDRDDVTMQWEDLDARIRALRASVDRLRALIENASSTADLIDAEEALSSRQGELDSLTAQQRRLDDQVALSTLTLSITAPGNGTGDDPDTFLDGLVAGWNSLIDWLEDAIVFAGRAIPWLGFLAVLGGLFWGVRRLIRRPRRAAGPVAATAATGDAATGKTAPDRKSDPSGKADPSGKTDVPGTTGLPGRTVEEKSEGAGGSGADRGAGDDQTEQP